MRNYLAALKSAYLFASQDIRYYLLHDILINSIASSYWMLRPLRYLLYRARGIRTATMDIRPGCRFKFSHITIGKNTFINNNCAFENFAHIDIGDNCAIAPEVMFCTTTHEEGNSLKRSGNVTGKPIKVGNGCWIGTRSLILPGVTIGKGCIIAAGAIVSRDCDPHGLYAGVPAKRLKDLQI